MLSAYVDHVTFQEDIMPVCCVDPTEFEKSFMTKRAATFSQSTRASELLLLHQDMT